MRSRITWLVLATTSTIVVSFVVPLCLLVRTLAEDRAMAAADQEARNVAIVMAGLGDDTQLAGLLAGLDDGEDPTTTVLTVDGQQLGPGPAMTEDPDVARALGGEAFRVVRDGGGTVVLPVVVGAGTAVVRTSVDARTLHQGVPRAWTGIIGLGVLLLLVAAAVARNLGRRISEPLLEVAGTAHRLREGALEARAPVRGTEETRELARALNGLAERTTELLASERAVVGDLSHRLRTPVTALRLDAEAVADPALSDRLQEHIGVLQRTIDSIVQEARRPVREDLGPRCDAAAVVTERVGFWRVLAEDQDRTLEVTVPAGNLVVPLPGEDLRGLVDILVDNVFAHTPDRTPFAVRLTARPGDGGEVVSLTVADEGPGFQGTSRRPRRSGTTGLGLDIARRTAEAVGGTLRCLPGPGGGALVEVLLPRLDEPA
ncbi:HAMP domain-containing sensor histidine kinase [Nocardioides daeguensis]|uniref:histidine kinase n=1 Tax=Nocardioides daeguensis TaxID=908359 RepID=A0ABP6W7H2_9ACTN|nr:HAMP domain-containing sensor histidine kinase [Nocardioides daeguensis]MBV6727668.1 HAMP domain-containing histidine kinase [Nocardioides daeguensis]MCR1775140.1 HAMP domain-containing histidine kinase [Nocardioides daeguensis]